MFNKTTINVHCFSRALIELPHKTIFIHSLGQSINLILSREMNEQKFNGRGRKRKAESE